MALASALADVDVTAPQFFVLASLLHTQTRGRPVPTQRSVAERTGLDPNTASQVIRGLERRRLVLRARNERDSRALTLTLTEEGLALAHVCTQRARALNRQFFVAVDGEALYRTLTELAADARIRRVTGSTRRQ